MAKWESNEPVSDSEVRKRYNALDRRIARCEKMQKQILDQIRNLNAREGEGPTIESWVNPDITHHVLAIVEDLQTDEKGAYIEEVKQVATEENLLKSETKIQLEKLTRQGYLLEKSPDHYTVVKYPEEERASEAEHPEEPHVNYTDLIEHDENDIVTNEEREDTEELEYTANEENNERVPWEVEQGLESRLSCPDCDLDASTLTSDPHSFLEHLQSEHGYSRSEAFGIFQNQ